MTCVHIDLDKRGPAAEGWFWDGGVAHNTFCQISPDMRSQRMNTLVTMMSGLVGFEGGLGAADGVCGHSIWHSPTRGRRRNCIFLSHVVSQRLYSTV